MRRYLFLLPFLAACHHSSSSSSATPSVAPENFTGVWAYDAEASRRAMGGMGGRGGGIGIGMGGRGGYGGRGGMGGGRGGRAPQRGEGREAREDGPFRAPSQIIITQSDSTLTLQPDRGDPLTLFFDGRKVSVTGPGGRSDSVAGHWDHKRYRVERRLGEMTVVETYERSKDQSKLTVRTQVQGGERRGPPITRVYDWVRRE